MPLPLATSLVLASLQLGWSFPSFRERIPNGRRVPCPDGAGGCDAGDASQCQPDGPVCNGVGHADCRGGAFPLNPFGAALQEAGYAWTGSLCQADSDKDGLTNGQELGDPCCLWTPGQEPWDYLLSFQPTHPGFQDSATTVANYVVPNCTEMAVASMGIVMGQFNEHEVQRSVDLRIKNYTIPSTATTYIDMALNFPAEIFQDADLYHLILAEAIVDQSRNLHHFIVTGCGQRWPDSMDGQPHSNMDAGCTETLGGWAPGRPLIETAPWMGVPFGPAVGVVALNVQVHYDNPSKEAGIVDSSGIRFFFTPTLREYPASTLKTMAISKNKRLVVPPGLKRWFITRQCELTVTDAAEVTPAEFHVSHVHYHAHLLGREMYMELHRPDSTTAIDLGSEPVWHFDDQYMRNVAAWNITLRTGDVLQSTCVMDSTGRGADTVFGSETTDEMCWGSLLGWSNYSGREALARCKGHAWTGQLGLQEHAFNLAARHPEDAALNVFDMKQLQTGGGAIRLNGKGVSSCTDAIDKCTQLRGAIAQAGISCDDNLGAINASINARLATANLMDICCKTACDSICPAHNKCSQVESPTEQAPVAPPELSPFGIRLPQCGFRTVHFGADGQPEGQYSGPKGQDSGPQNPQGPANGVHSLHHCTPAVVAYILLVASVQSL